MLSNSSIKGIAFALTAAALNGSIGVLSKILLQHNLSAEWIAFTKTAIGWLIVSAVLLAFKPWIEPEQQAKSSLPHIAIAAFFGIFLLFYFETAAYQKTSAANAVVVLMASSVAMANLAGSWLLNDRIGRNQWMGLSVTVVGIAILAQADSQISLPGFAHAACAGMGYGLFTVLLKKFQLRGSLSLTRWLLFFGAIYLSIPAAPQSIDLGILRKPEIIAAVLALAVFPSILGFVCTTKAVNHLPPAKVQLLELSEPLFAALLAYIFLNEAVTLRMLFGASLVLLGIYLGAMSRDGGSARADPAPSRT